MKLNFFLSLLLFSCASFAQTPAILQNLEGTWSSSDRSKALYSQWVFTGKNTMVNHTYTLICGDTLPLSKSQISFDAHTARLTLWIDSLNHSQPRHFRLVRAGADELFWENENPDQTPARLGWILYGPNYLIFRADGVETDFRYVKTGKARFQWRFQSGIRWNNRHAFTNDVFPQGLQHTLVNYQIHPGFEYALSLGLRAGDSPLSCYVEFGYSQKKITVASILRDDELRYLRKDHYEFTNLYLGLMPELVFGPRRAIGIMSGIFFNIRADARYKSDTRILGNGTPNPSHLYPAGVTSPEGGLVLGASYGLPIKWTGNFFHPEIYTRSIVNIGGKPRFCSLSAGVRLRMGKEG